MIEFNVLNRFSGAVQFTAEIDCDEGADRSIKLGLAVKWAILSGANLSGASLCGASGLNDWVKCIQIEDWPITYTSDTMQIGCQRHPLEAWKNFTDAEIRAMDGRKALTFWSKWKGWIFQTIEMAPALPTQTDQVSQ